MDPFKIFTDWYATELKHTTAKLPDACCLSSIGLDGYPNARFVAFKELKNDAFIVCGPLNSRKGRELEVIPKAALTFWWTATEKQVRLQGDVSVIPGTEADKYFAERSRESRIISAISKQGQPIDNIDTLVQQYETEKLGDVNIARLENWGGIAIAPVRMEFLEFSADGFHRRTLYHKTAAGWAKVFLQP